jgi:hypothetical protein
VFIIASLSFVPIFTAWGYIYVETYTHLELEYPTAFICGSVRAIMIGS